MADMKQLEKLPEMTERAMGGLQAGPGLKYRITQAAANDHKVRFAFRPAAAALCAAAVVLCAVLIPVLNKPAAPLNVVSAGAPVEGTLLADTTLHGGAVTSSAPGVRSMWATAKDGAFPMVIDHGKVYRMLTTPAEVPSALLGTPLGVVELMTDEPALADANALMSNVAAPGETVYEIHGMGGTLVACKVGDSMKLFQRVSFNGNALIGGERLADTLRIGGHVVRMELEGVGEVTDDAALGSLTDTLLGSAAYENAGQVAGSQTLTITLDNGLQVQLLVKGNRLSACGTWSCPAFFEAFAAAAK